MRVLLTKLGERRILNSLLLIVVSAILLTLPGCKNGSSSNSGPQKSARQNVITRILHDPSVGPLFSELAEEFMRQRTSHVDGRKIKIELTSMQGLKAADQLASGRLKLDGWIPSSKSLVNYANDNIRNLGARQIDCKSIFGSPITLAVHRSDAKKLEAEGRQIAWQTLFSKKTGEAENEGEKVTRVSLHQHLPLDSATGLSTLVQLAYLADGKLSEPLNVNTLKSGYAESKLSTFQSSIGSYANDGQKLLRRIAQREAETVRVGLTTEQQIAQFNSENPPAQIHALYLKGGTYWQDYQFCRSDADWVTKKQQTALSLFFDFLTSPQSQSKIESKGFRAAVVPDPGNGILTREFGTSRELPAEHFKPVSGAVVQHLINVWPEIRRPVAVTVVADHSGSMEGEPLQVVREEIKQFVSRLSNRDKVALVTFSSRANLLSEFTTDKSSILYELDKLESQGGSAIYDAIKIAFQLFAQKDLNTFRKTVVVVTDGEDKNSDISLSLLINMVRNSLTHQNVNLVVVALTGESGKDFQPLEELVAAAHGTLVKGDIVSIREILGELSRNI